MPLINEIKKNDILYENYFNKPIVTYTILMVNLANGLVEYAHVLAEYVDKDTMQKCIMRFPLSDTAKQLKNSFFIARKSIND